MSAQLDLFAPPPRDVMAGQSAGWERRYLAELADGPTVCCFPGWAGHHHQALVDQGLAAREDAGFLDPIAGVCPDIQATAKFKAHVREYWKAPHPQYRYSITDAGRSAL